jgi:hypothetical protein
VKHFPEIAIKTIKSIADKSMATGGEAILTQQSLSVSLQSRIRNCILSVGYISLSKDMRKCDVDFNALQYSVISIKIWQQ